MAVSESKAGLMADSCRARGPDRQDSICDGGVQLFLKETIVEFDSDFYMSILFLMSIQMADLRKLVKIVRQYEVIYGGGISTSDAAVREECEGLVGLLEAELGSSRRSAKAKAKETSTLPSLVDSKRKPKGAGTARPLTARSSELASLSSSAKAVRSSPAESAAPKPPKTKAAGQPGKRETGQAEPKKAEGANAKAKAESMKAKAQPAKAKPESKKLEPKKAEQKKTQGKKVEPKQAESPKDGRGLDEDVRSRHVGAAKAAERRLSQISDKPGGAEAKKRFAAMHLFDAFRQSKLPKYGGFIVCVRFSEGAGYAVIEIIGYGNMQDMYPDGDTLVFKSVGCKLYAIVEPPAYLLKSVEPVNRPEGQMVPYRFSELLTHTTKRFQNVFIGRKPVFMPTSFSVLKPEGEDLAVLFYDIAEVYQNIQDFLIIILRDRLGVPVPDSRKAAEIIARGIREFRIWIDEA
jgi:hypothetical protein